MINFLDCLAIGSDWQDIGKGVLGVILVVVGGAIGLGLGVRPLTALVEQEKVRPYSFHDVSPKVGFLLLSRNTSSNRKEGTMEGPNKPCLSILDGIAVLVFLVAVFIGWIFPEILERHIDIR